MILLLRLERCVETQPELPEMRLHPTRRPLLRLNESLE